LALGQLYRALDLLAEPSAVS